MGLNGSEIRVRIWKYTMISSRTCSKTVCSHPFLVGMLCFLILVYRSFPLVFSVLVSASPVVVCTAILLGTLLSFGESNIPEIEYEEIKAHDEIAALKSVGVHRDELHTEKMSDVVEMSNEQFTVRKADGLDDHVPLLGVNEEVEEGSRDMAFEHEQPSNGIGFDNGRIVSGNRDLLLPEDGEDEKFDSEYVRVGDHQDSSSILTWKKEEEDNNEHCLQHNDIDDGEYGYHDDESEGSESDRAESSSPDASMADIIPMLDELHPLLDLEAPQPAHMSDDDDDSDAASELSHRSSESSVESDEVPGNQEDDVEDDNDDDEKEDEVHGNGEDGNKAAITWTEDDQKNLMDLGTSELERNQRLENLIARRRARKNLRLMAEKNLIDLESADLPFTIAPISTTRSNPFDLPYDSSIPGSAPSVLLPRRNPFDLPYDINEERPNLMGDSFEHEFLSFHQKDTFSRRHESFSLGPTRFGGFKPETQDIKWRPYFVPERQASEGTSYSSFQRQSGELSDSRVSLSSVPETDSVCSAADQEDKKLGGPDILQQTDHISVVDQTLDLAESLSQSVEDVDSVEIDLIGKRVVEQDDVEIKIEDSGNHLVTETHLAATGGMTNAVEFNQSETYVNQKIDEDSEKSNLSQSEVDEKLIDVEKNRRGNVTDEVDTSIQSSLEESENAMIDDILNKDPVYDSSPPAVEKDPSFSSISSDTQRDLSEKSSPLISDKANVLFVNEISGAHSKIMQKVAPGNDKIQTGISLINPGSEIKSTSSEFAVVSEPDVPKIRSPLFEQNTEVGQKLPSEDSALSASEEQPSLMVEHVSGFRRKLSSLESESFEKKSEDKDQVIQIEHPDAIIGVDVDQDVDTMPVFTDPRYLYEPSEVKSLPAWDKEPTSSEKSAPQKTFSGHIEAKEPSLTEVESTEKVHIADNLNMPKVHGAHFNPDPTLITAVDLKGESEKAENEDRGLVPGDLNFSAKAFEYGVALHNSIEETNENREIDEGLLAELDAVGDFSVKRIESNHNEIESIPAKNGFDLLVARDIKEIDKEIVMQSYAVDCIDTQLKETNLKLPIIEAKSLEDIHKALEQIHEGVDVEEVILPSFIDERPVLADSEYLAGTDLHLQVIEAAAQQDIHTNLKELTKDTVKKQLVSLDSKVEVEEKTLGSSKIIKSSGEESHVPKTDDKKQLVSSDSKVEVEENGPGSTKIMESNGEESNVPKTGDEKQLVSSDSKIEVEEKTPGSSKIIESSHEEHTVPKTGDKKQLVSLDSKVEVEEKGPDSSRIIVSSGVEPNVPKTGDKMLLVSLDSKVEDEEKRQGSSKIIVSSGEEPNVPKTGDKKLLVSLDSKVEDEEKRPGSSKIIVSSGKEPNVPKTGNKKLLVSLDSKVEAEEKRPGSSMISDEKQLVSLDSKVEVEEKRPGSSKIIESSRDEPNVPKTGNEKQLVSSDSKVEVEEKRSCSSKIFESSGEKRNVQETGNDSSTTPCHGVDGIVKDSDLSKQ